MTDSVSLVPSEPSGPLPELAPQGEAPAPAVNPLQRVHALLRGRYLWASLLGGVLAAGLAVGGWFVKPAEYRSVGVVRLQTSPRVVLHDTPDRILAFADAYLANQVSLIQNRRTIDLAMQDPEWVTLGRGTSNEAISKFIEKLEVTHPRSSELIQVTFLDKDPTAAQIAVRAVIRAYRQLYEELEVNKDSQVIKTLEERRKSLELRVETLRQRIQTIAAEDGSEDLASRYRSKIERLNDLEIQLQAASLDVAWAEAALHLTVGGAPTTAPGTTAPATTIPATGPALAATTAPATRPAVSAEALAETNGELRNLLHDRLTAQQTLGRLRGRYGDNHWAVISAQKDLDTLNKAIEDFIAALPTTEKAVSNNTVILPGQGPVTLEQLRSKEQKIRSMYEQTKAEALDLGRKDLQIKSLHTELDTVQTWLLETKTRLDTLNTENQNPGQQTGQSLARLDILNPGDRPLLPFSDRRIPLSVVGGVLGLVLGFGTMALVGFFDRRVKTVADARLRFRQRGRLLGILPTLPEDLADPDQAGIAAYCVHHIRTLLQISTTVGERKAFAITSPAAADGKTSLTLALGLSFAASDSKTLLIDCDVAGAGLTARMDAIIRRKIGHILVRERLITEEQLKRALDQARHANRRLGEVLVELGYVSEADLNRALGLQRESLVGLLDVLNGEPLEACIGETGSPGLWIMPVGGAHAAHAGQISLRAVQQIIDAARRQFDVILIDTGPILGSLESSVVAAAVDEVVLVVSRGQQRPLVDRALEHLESVGARLAGIVFNRALDEDLPGSIASSTVTTPARSPTSGAAPSDAAPRMGPVARAVVSSTVSNPGGSK